MEEGDHYLKAPYPTYGAGDVIGCGVDFTSRSVYFTKNGVRLGGEAGVAFHMIGEDLLVPVIGVGSEGTEVGINFGDKGAFAYLG
jgi:Ran-binding protein 9/10